MAAKLVVIYWRDIPAQVNAQAGRTRHQIVLDHRFQLAIDRAAMVADKTLADEYVAEWRRDTTPCGEDLEAEATARATEIDAIYDRDRLDALVANGGFEPST